MTEDDLIKVFIYMFLGYFLTIGYYSIPVIKNYLEDIKKYKKT